MLDWTPAARSRKVGRPTMRWEDAITEFAREVGISWRAVAQDRGRWEEMEQRFVRHGRESAARGAARQAAL